MSSDPDLVFKALADTTRRHLLDRLREHDGLTLAELCEGIEMTRQSATQHLAVLEAANLISTQRRGREKLHHLNVVPLHEMQERWIDRFDRPRLRALSDIKRRAEEAAAMTEKHTFVYVTYIEATPDQVWEALTSAEATARYWGHANVSTWEVGATWEHQRLDGSGVADVCGDVVVSDRPTRLVTTWKGSHEDPDDTASRVTFDLLPYGEICRLTVTHEDLPPEELKRASAGWAAVCSNLKSLLETGHPLPQKPWEMYREDWPEGYEG